MDECLAPELDQRLLYVGVHAREQAGEPVGLTVGRELRGEAFRAARELIAAAIA